MTQSGKLRHDDPGPATADRSCDRGGRRDRGPRPHRRLAACCPRSSIGSSRWGGPSRSTSARSASGGSDPSYARIAIRAETPEAIDAILGDLVEHGASPVHPEDARTVPADIAGAFPEDFYSTTNQQTQVRLRGRWIDVQDQEMDCGIVLDPAGRHGPVRADDPRDRRACRSSSAMPACGSSPLERPRESTPVRLHELHRLEREAQVGQPAERGRGDPLRREPRARRSCWWAARRSSIPARRRTSPG